MKTPRDKSIGNKKKVTSFEEHLSKRYGRRGTEKRTEFEIKAKAFMIGELIRGERHQAKLTQEQLADKIGAKKEFYFADRKWSKRHPIVHTLPPFGIWLGQKSGIDRALRLSTVFSSR